MPPRMAVNTQSSANSSSANNDRAKWKGKATKRLPPKNKNMGSRVGTSYKPNGRRYSVYEAVAGKVHSTTYIPPHSQRRTLYSTRSSVLSAPQVLFRRQRAPMRYAENDIYVQHQLLPPHLLPQSDLLKCLHAFVSDFTHGKALLHQRKSGRLLSEEGPIFTFWDQMSEVLYGIEPPCSPPADADPEYLLWRQEAKGKQDRKERYEKRKEELEKLTRDIDSLGPVPDNDDGGEAREKWELKRQALLSARGLGKVDIDAAAKDPSKAREALRAIKSKEDQNAGQGRPNKKMKKISNITLHNTLLNRGATTTQTAIANPRLANTSYTTRSNFTHAHPPRRSNTSRKPKSPIPRPERLRRLLQRCLRAHRTFDGSALLALGILAEELCGASLGQRGHNVLVEGLVADSDGDERYVGHGRGAYKDLWRRRGPRPGFREQGGTWESEVACETRVGDDEEEEEEGQHESEWDDVSKIEDVGGDN